MNNMQPELRALWFTLIVLFATVVGVASGLLQWLDSHRVPSAILYGAGAFGATIGLAVAVLHFLRGPASPQ